VRREVAHYMIWIQLVIEDIQSRKQALNLGINDGDNEGNAKNMLLPLIEVKFRAERSIQFSPGYFLYMNNHCYGLKLRNEFRREKD
jgi:hypothetical protein